MENDNQNLNSQPVPQLSVPKKWYQHKGIITIAVLAVLAGATVWVYFVRQPSQKVSQVVVKYEPSRGVLSAAPNASSSELSATSTPAQSSTSTDQTLILNFSLVVIPDQKLFICKNADCSQMTLTYYDTDTTIPSGLYAGDKVMLLDCDCIGGEGETDSFFRFINPGTGNILLQKYSVDLSSFMQEWGDTFSQGQFIVDDKTNISVLNPYPQITDPKTGAVLKLSLTSLDTGSFFNHDGRKPFFTDNYNEPVYVAESLPGSYSADPESFEVEAQDGTDLWYELSDPFLSAANEGTGFDLNIKWNDGAANHHSLYQFDPAANSDKDLASCEEGGDYVNAVSNPISESDLTVAGTNAQGQPIYEFKDPNNPVLLAAKAEIEQPDDSSQQATDSQNTITQTYSPDVVIFWRDPFGRLVRFVSNDLVQFCGGKPVIYLYPTKPTSVSVQVSPAGGISKSIPQYNNGWNVFAQPNGTLTANGQQYPYLFWEGGLGSYQTPTAGFVVSKPEVKALLDTKLAFIGLNSKEISDFEQFWLPRMQSAPYYFVTFTTNSEMEKYAPLTITPNPDTIIRVLMDYKPLQSDETVMPLNLQPTKRQGFTVVEWGGILK